MIRKILIANRGEIAVRIARTCRSMGIATVALYTAADRTSLHVEHADEAVEVVSYTSIDAVLDAAVSTGADSLHPGYGFLAENADFAEACEQAGITFIGPRSEVVRQMGMKDAGRALAVEAGVPVVPEAKPGDFPLLIKAAAGGGGRGMRIVRGAEDLDQAVAAARAEAERLFGNRALLFERYIENARHVEVQIFGDHDGQILHFGERDCSVQRRHQKLIEESPSPELPTEIRQRMCDAAIALGRAMKYTNAGTVEFLVAPDGEFYFIEVNTRIQVEHPVTEERLNIDMIRMQIEVAEGRPVGKPIVPSQRHAIEVRICAEDPARDFTPCTGRIHVWRPPQGVSARLDSGVRQGSDVGVEYDSMLAKMIVCAEDRDLARRKLVHALRSLWIGGVTTNQDYLVQVLEHPDFIEGRAHTGWSLSYSRPETPVKHFQAAAAHMIAANREARGILPGVASYWRNNPSKAQEIVVESNGEERRTSVAEARSWPGVEVIEVGGVRFVKSQAAASAISRSPRFRAADSARSGTASSPMPGRILRILVGEGQIVRAGDPLVILEAMKMEQTISTAINGRIARVLVKADQVIAPGQMLVEIASTESTNEHASSGAADR